MSSSLIFQDLETRRQYTTIDMFIQAHRGFKMINRQTISFEGAEDIDHPLAFLIVDGIKIPRYKIFLNMTQQIDLDLLTSFLDSKRAFWMISSIDVWVDMSGNNVLKTAKVEMFLHEWKNMIWQLASNQITQRLGNGPQAPAPPMQIQMPQLPPPAPMGIPHYGPPPLQPQDQSQQIVPMGPAAAPVPPQAPPAPAAILKSAFPDMFV